MVGPSLTPDILPEALWLVRMERQLRVITYLQNPRCGKSAMGIMKCLSAMLDTSKDLGFPVLPA
jgi:hypothetical protein